MKYSDVLSSDSRFEVTWNIVPDRKNRTLELSWLEETDREVTAPETFGFGSRLMEALVRGELNGKIDRQFTSHGVTIGISIPLN